jgi:hypothetical protein
VLGRIIGKIKGKKSEQNGGKNNNKQIHNFYFSPNIIGVMKAGRVK